MSNASPIVWREGMKEIRYDPSLSRTERDALLRQSAKEAGMLPPDENDKDIVLYTIEDIQRIFQIGRTKAYALVASAGFPTIRINKKTLVPKKQLNEWIDKNIGKSWLL